MHLLLTIKEKIVFMGREEFLNIPLRILTLVEDLFACDAYPWGEYTWNYFYQKTLNVVPKHVEMHMKLKKQSGKKMATYNLNGFVWALKLFHSIVCKMALAGFKLKPRQNVDEAPIVNEESVEIDDKSSGIDVHDPVATSESNKLLDDVDSLFKKVIDVRPDHVGRTLRPPPFDDSQKPNDSKGDENNCYYQESQLGSLQHLLNALEPELPPDVSFLQPNNVDEPHFDTIVKDNAEMEDNMDVDNEDGKYCLDNMSIGFEKDTSNEEIKVNLDQFIVDLMYTENMYVAIESHSSELYQIMNMSEEKLVKINDRASLKTSFRVVRRKKKPVVALQSPYE
uniref:Phospholipase-like protein n=1 Tax=Tanacetum cinerariifolium TaxID=118510 RepID=A0A699H2N0_TANCI|nr:phospholipase-like protein [Tanacetum cinerariifolium]GEX32132.1 phospholipase-like protein [Tanacetum cinerariifolium]